MLCKKRTSEYAKICLDVILVAYSKKVELESSEVVEATKLLPSTIQDYQKKKRR